MKKNVRFRVEKKWILGISFFFFAGTDDERFLNGFVELQLEFMKEWYSVFFFWNERKSFFVAEKHSFGLSRHECAGLNFWRISYFTSLLQSPYPFGSGNRAAVNWRTTRKIGYGIRGLYRVAWKFTQKEFCWYWTDGWLDIIIIIATIWKPRVLGLTRVGLIEKFPLKIRSSCERMLILRRNSFQGGI